MRPAKRVTWAVLSSVVGFGLLAILGALAFAFLGKPKQVNPGAALSEMMNKVDSDAIRIGAVGSGLPSLVAEPKARSVENPTAANPPPRAEVDDESPSDINAAAPVAPGQPAIVVAAAVPGPPTASSTGPTAPEPTATAATADAIPTTTAPTTEAEAPPEPPPGADKGLSYCGATTCVVGFKCCCDGCVPFDQACDPRSCAAQSGLSISVACGMDLCDPGEICCDARCGECARYGECPEEPCK